MTTVNDLFDEYEVDENLIDFTGRLLTRPEPLGGIELPTIRNIQESGILCEFFGAVLTAGPTAQEVAYFGHPNHRVWSFGDTNHGVYGPQRAQVAEMLEWGSQQEDLLVHCHAGMSRSTATAWGISIVKGADAYDSLVALYNSHPIDYDGKPRWFCPNALLVHHIQNILGRNDLLDIRHEVLEHDERISHWL